MVLVQSQSLSVEVRGEGLHDPVQRTGPAHDTLLGVTDSRENGVTAEEGFLE